MNYKIIYDKLMQRAPKTKTDGVYLERHRIVPGCMGGEYVYENIAFLTPEEHYLAHQLLVKIYPNNYKLLYAAEMMSKGVSVNRGQRNNKLYGWLQRKLSKLKSETMSKNRKNGTIPTHNKGKPNPKQKELFLTNNPMKNPEIAQKVRSANLGKEANNKIKATYIKTCKNCNKEEIKFDTVHNRLNVFCGKSCAASWSNRNRPHKRGYTFTRKKETKPRRKRNSAGVCEI